MLHVGDLGDERRRRLARLGVIDEAIERRRPAAADAERRKLAALADQEHIGAAVGQRLDLVDRAEPAAMLARPGGVRPQRPLREHHRIERLQDFHRRDGRGRDRIVAVVEAVALGIAAEPAAEEAEHDPAPADRSRQPASDSALMVANGLPLARSGATLAKAPKITSMTRRMVSV